MDWQHRRLLELAGIKRRRTPDHLLTEGDDEGGDDLFGDDDSGGDDEGGDDLFGGDDDAGGDDAGGDTAGDEGDTEGPGSNREPPEELEAKDIEKFGSPRFLDLENKLQRIFNDAWASGSAAAQGIESYPGNAIDEEPPTPAKDDSPPEEEPKEDKAADEGADDEGDADEKEDEDKNESFYRYGNRRDKWLISEATRLLSEAESEGSAADEFDMERFCTDLANYLDTVHNTEDIEGSIFNSARQMVMNNFGKHTEGEFIDMLAAVTDNKWDFLGTHGDDQQVPLAVGASASAGA